MKFTLKEMNLIKFSVEKALDNTILKRGVKDTPYNRIINEQIDELTKLLDKIENSEL